MFGGHPYRLTACFLLALISHSQAMAQRVHDKTPQPSLLSGESGDTSVVSTRDVDFWIGIELGCGLASPICAPCGENGPQSGTNGNLHLGFGLGENFLVGAQVSLWVIDGGLYSTRNDHIYRNHFMLVSYYFPQQRSGFFAKMGVGLSAYSAYDRYRPAMKDSQGKDLPSLVRSDGFGFLIGGGNDFKVADKLFLSLSLTYFNGKLGPLVLNDTRDLKVKKALNLMELNVGLMFRPG